MFIFFFFFFNDTATTEIYTLSLHDALPISPVVRTDAACIWATGVTWWQVPPVAKMVLKGSLSPGVVGKDVIIALCGLFNKDEVLNHAVEFVGDGVTNLPMSARMTIANMTTEWGALAGVFPFDEVTVNYLRSRV